MPRNGRPPKKTEEKRAILRVRLSVAEKQTIGTNAQLAGFTVSEYLRRCALQKHITSKVNLKAVAELNRLGGLQKYCLKQIEENPGLPGCRHELNATLNAIVKTLDRLRSDDQEE